MGKDSQIREAAFVGLHKLAARYGDAIPWGAIERGFHIGNERFHFSSRARGIFRPKRMERGVLSIKTTIPRRGRINRYDDVASDAGFFDYHFMGDDPHSIDNRALKESMDDGTPIIYFHAVATSYYQAIWPAFVVDWNPKLLSVRVVPGEVAPGGGALPASDDTRRYTVAAVKRRLHQAIFRELVLDAYEGRCALSGLSERRLVHAAHILPDRDERGLPTITNGIAMSALHHAAYDADLLGIDADGGIHINRSLLEMHDGPVLEQALKGLHGRFITLPKHAAGHPNREYLELRFNQFAMHG